MVVDRRPALLNHYPYRIWADSPMGNLPEMEYDPPKDQTSIAIRLNSNPIKTEPARYSRTGSVLILHVDKRHDFGLARLNHY